MQTPFSIPDAANFNPFLGLSLCYTATFYLDLFEYFSTVYTYSLIGREGF